MSLTIGPEARVQQALTSTDPSQAADTGAEVDAAHAPC
jgi:hypothetical protein